MSLSTWIEYIVALLFVCMSPGAGALAAMASGLSHGFRHGFWIVLGLEAGVVFLIVIAASGLGAILAASHSGLTVVKWFGVVYLIYLGIQQWRHSGHLAKTERVVATESRRSMIRRGFLVNASNPKAVIFMLAIMPQFLVADRPILPQYMILTISMVGVDTIMMAVYSGLATQLVRLLRNPIYTLWIQRGFACIYVLLAVLLVQFHP